MSKRLYLIITLIAALTLMGAIAAMADDCGAAPKTEATVKATTTNAVAPANGQKLVLNVSGMTCGACVNTVTKSLSAVNGVSDVTVNLEKGTAELVYDPAKVKPDMLAEAVSKAGYSAKPADAAPASAKAAGCAATCGAKKGCDPSACGMKTATTGTPKKGDDK